MSEILSNIKMFGNKILVKKKYKIVVCLFFITYFLIGTGIFKDYSVSWDESAARERGKLSVEYVINGNQSLFSIEGKYHGPAFEMLLFTIEKYLNLSRDSRAIYLMRHFVTFLLFYTSVWFFYLLCKRGFQSWRIGLLGSLFLIMSPRLFAHSFYNSKDVAFLAFFIISIYTLVRFLDKKTLGNAFLHALTCALLVDVRIPGVIIPFFTLISFGIDLLTTKSENGERKKIIKNLLGYVILLICFIILFWPFLWPHPFRHFIESFKLMVHYSPASRTENLYLGKYLKSTNLPWHYIPLWVIISTPIIYTIFFFVGCFASLKLLLKNPKTALCLNEKNSLLYLLWFFLPLITVVVLKSILYTAWRQMFFIYPAFLMISLEGLIFLLEYFEIKFKGLRYKIINTVFIAAVIANLVKVTGLMVKYHPFQDFYFNRLAGKNLEEAGSSFDLDYWGLSYRQALEYILKNDKSSAIKIYVVDDTPGKLNAQILNDDNRNRLVYVDNPRVAEYFIAPRRGQKDEYLQEKEYYSVKVDGAKIMMVYKMN